MEGSCSTGQSPQRAVVVVEEEEEEEEYKTSVISSHKTLFLFLPVERQKCKS
jgi:hypothetical protein